jgi:cathepsin B
VTAAAVFSDRLCIVNNITIPRSAADVLACCPTCGNCATGGLVNATWTYFQRVGVVSGYGYGVAPGASCFPYPIGCDQPPCQGIGVAPGAQPADAVQPTPACPVSDDGAGPTDEYVECPDPSKGYYVPWQVDKLKAKAPYRPPIVEAELMQELMSKGSMITSFVLTTDFDAFDFSQGAVYRYQGGQALGYHAVRVMGWGTHPTDGDYWLAANSWGTQWGGVGGYFRIGRWDNNVGFESFMWAGDVCTQFDPDCLPPPIAPAPPPPAKFPPLAVGILSGAAIGVALTVVGMLAVRWWRARGLGWGGGGRHGYTDPLMAAGGPSAERTPLTAAATGTTYV